MSQFQVSSGGGGMFLIFVVLLILKLAGVITLSWWLVTLPLWIGFAIAAGALALGALLFIVCVPFYLLFKAIF